MIRLNIHNEMSPLHSVILGRADSNGGTPTIEEAYDPKSIEHIKAGTYPAEDDMVKELEGFREVLEKYGVKVYRPELLEDTNQIFARDLGFVIGDKFVVSNMIPNREHEQDAIGYLLDEISGDKRIQMPESARIEGGDVIVHGDFIFVGTYSKPDFNEIKTARTNREAVELLKQFFPGKEVRPFDLIKSMTNARENALHLDCCFQPVGEKYAVIYPGGFSDKADVDFLVSLFGRENILFIDKEDMYNMSSNFFSIRPDVVVSETRLDKLNDWLRSKGITVEAIPYYEIGKQEGLLRCSTLPLYRE